MLAKKIGLFLILSGTRENRKKIISGFVRTVVFENTDVFVCMLICEVVSCVWKYSIWCIFRLEVKQIFSVNFLKRARSSYFKHCWSDLECNFKTRCSLQIDFAADLLNSFTLPRVSYRSPVKNKNNQFLQGILYF